MNMFAKHASIHDFAEQDLGRQWTWATGDDAVGRPHRLRELLVQLCSREPLVGSNVYWDSPPAG